MRALDRRFAIRVVGERDLPDPWLARPAGGVEHLPQLGLGLDGDHQVGLVAGQLARALARDRDPDRDALARPVPQLGLLDLEVAAAVVDPLRRRRTAPR